MQFDTNVRSWPISAYRHHRLRVSFGKAWTRDALVKSDANDCSSRMQTPGQINLISQLACGALPWLLKRPLVNHIRPILQHRPTLITVFSLVVDSPYALLLVRKALLNPV